MREPFIISSFAEKSRKKWICFMRIILRFIGKFCIFLFFLYFFFLYAHFHFISWEPITTTISNMYLIKDPLWIHQLCAGCQNLQFNKLLTYLRFSFQPVNFRLFEYILYVLFNCLFVYGFLSYSNLLLIWTSHHFRWSGFEFKHILCHSLSLSYKDISEYLWHHALGNGTISTYFDDLRPSRPGLESRSPARNTKYVYIQHI